MGPEFDKLLETSRYLTHRKALIDAISLGMYVSACLPDKNVPGVGAKPIQKQFTAPCQANNLPGRSTPRSDRERSSNLGQ